MKILASYNIKGGVGKTASAVNLAYAAAKSGRRTLLWDLDPQGSATFYFRVKPRIKGGAGKLLRKKAKVENRIRESDYEGLDLLPADFSMRNLDVELDGHKRPERRLAGVLKRVRDIYDIVILDCAPNISVSSEAVFEVADALLVPTVPTTLSLRTLDQLADHLDKLGTPVELMPYFCRVDRRKRMHRSLTETARGGRHSFLDTTIPNSSLVERMGEERAPVETYSRNSAPAKAYRALWAEIRRRLQA